MGISQRIIQQERVSLLQALRNGAKLSENDLKIAFEIAKQSGRMDDKLNYVSIKRALQDQAAKEEVE